MNTEKTTVEIKIESGWKNDLAPLYGQYPGQSHPQPAFIVIAPESDRVFADNSGEVGSNPALPAEVVYGRILRYSVAPNITGTDLIEIFESKKFSELVDRIVGGYDNTWDTNSNIVGCLNADAQTASDELETFLLPYEDGGNYEGTSIWDAGDWFDGDCPPDLTASSTDYQLDKIAEKIYAEATDLKCVVDGVDDYLIGCRAQMREEQDDSWFLENH
jgi:hypothetical protein